MVTDPPSPIPMAVTWLLVLATLPLERTSANELVQRISWDQKGFGAAFFPPQVSDLNLLEMSQTGAPPPNSCRFFVTKKKRFCKMIAASGKIYCGEHATMVSSGTLRSLENKTSNVFNTFIDFRGFRV